MPWKVLPASGTVILGLLIVALLTKNATDRANAGDAKAPKFEADVQPILQASCVRCHGEKRRGDLDLRTFAGLMKGGESGPSIVPGKADKSLLYKKIHEGAMPADKKGMLKPAEIALIRRWIDVGAPSASAVIAPEVTQHNIEPIMAMRCAVCHGLRKQEAGLDLRTRASMLKGGRRTTRRRHTSAECRR
jgi:mono/diheme cytochrome c family protein